MKNIEKFLTFFLCNVLKLRASEDKIKVLAEFIKFSCVGVFNVVFSYVVYLAALLGIQKAFGTARFDYIIAQTISFLVSVFVSFLLNRAFVFTSEDGELNFVKALIKSYCAYGFTGIVLNNLLSVIWIDYIGISKLIAPIINLIINVPLNFVLNKIWAFRTKKIDKNKD